MSNYSSVIFAWDKYAAEDALGRDAYTREAIEDALYNLADVGECWHVRDAQLFLGLPLDEPMCCEDGARLCINHLDPAEFWPAVAKHIPWMYHEDSQAWWKDEGADRYEEIPNPLAAARGEPT